MSERRCSAIRLAETRRRRVESSWDETPERSVLRVGGTNYLPRGADAVTVQPDGKIIAAGELQDGRSNRYFGAFRYLPDGELDASFGAGGWTALDIGSFEEARAVAIQGDGKIIVAGETDCATARCFAAVRLNRDGSVDGGFGTGGVVRKEFYLQASWANDVAIDRHGRIVLAGVRLRGGDAQDSGTGCVLRLSPDGRLDPTFSRDGVALLDHGYGNDSAEAVLLHRGRIVIAGRGKDSAAGARFRIARFHDNGRLDRSFGRRGHRLVSFGNAGRVRTRPGRFGGYALAVAAPTAGSVLVAGRAFTDATRDASDWALVRYSRGGRRDRSFGNNGIVQTDFGSGSDEASALALVPGRAVAAGSIYSSLGIARYLTG